MELPTNMKIGRSWYRVWYQKQPPRTVCYGRINYDIRTITVYDRKASGAPFKPADVRETFWHEVTHGVLYEMNHPLYKDEKFVTEFSRLLSKAIDSARFSSERV
jgi:hypothetical protein